MHSVYDVRTWCALALVLAVAGCGGTTYKVAPVSGVVKLDGAPLAGASVTFVPESAAAVSSVGVGSYGKTDESGRYTLLLIENDAQGAAVGKHKVTISAVQGDDPTSEADVAIDRVPERYRGSTSELTFDVVPAGTQDANFDLTTGASRGS